MERMNEESARWQNAKSATNACGGCPWSNSGAWLK
jgi:hypothetical protein